MFTIRCLSIRVRLIIFEDCVVKIEECAGLIARSNPCIYPDFLSNISEYTSILVQAFPSALS